MKREILMNTTARETRVAILEDDVLVELMVDRPDAARMVGDIYKGRVEAVLPGIQAAFVDVGTEKAAFLHVSDVALDEAHGPARIVRPDRLRPPPLRRARRNRPRERPRGGAGR